MTANDKPAVDKANPVSARTAARVAAIQALYQMELSGADLNDVITEFLSERFESGRPDETIEGADRTFFADVLRAVLRRQRDIDPLIDEQLAQGWSLVRVDAILRAVLRAGVAELMERVDVPARVVINEYVNVAHFFFDGDEPRVANGVLDKIARRVRSAEFLSKKRAGAERRSADDT